MWGLEWNRPALCDWMRIFMGWPPGENFSNLIINWGMCKKNVNICKLKKKKQKFVNANLVIDQNA